MLRLHTEKGGFVPPFFFCFARLGACSAYSGYWQLLCAR